MNYEQIVSLIGSVGFPILMCGALCWYVYKVNSEMQKSLDNLEDAIQRLIDKIDNKG